MSIAAEVTETVYALAGANLGPFATGWTYVQPSDVTAQLDPGTGVMQPLEQDVDFTLTGLMPSTNGGQATLSASLFGGASSWPDGAKLALIRSSTTATDTEWGSSLQFDPADPAAAIDAVGRKLQEVVTAARRALTTPPTEAPQTWPPRDQLKGKFVFGDPDTGDITRAAGVTNITGDGDRWAIQAAGGETSFATGLGVSANFTLQLFRGGVALGRGGGLLTPDVDYAVTFGGLVTLLTDPANAGEFWRAVRVGGQSSQPSPSTAAGVAYPPAGSTRPDVTVQKALDASPQLSLQTGVLANGVADDGPGLAALPNLARFDAGVSTLHIASNTTLPAIPIDLTGATVIIDPDVTLTFAHQPRLALRHTFLNAYGVAGLTYASPLHWGAIGDYNGATYAGTDNHDAIFSAFSAVINAGTSIGERPAVFMGRGNFKSIGGLATVLALDTPLTIRGAGWAPAVGTNLYIEGAGAVGWKISTAAPAGDLNQLTDWSVEDLALVAVPGAAPAVGFLVESEAVPPGEMDNIGVRGGLRNVNCQGCTTALQEQSAAKSRHENTAFTASGVVVKITVGDGGSFTGDSEFAGGLWQHAGATANAIMQIDNSDTADAVADKEIAGIAFTGQHQWYVGAGGVGLSFTAAGIAGKLRRIGDIFSAPAIQLEGGQTGLMALDAAIAGNAQLDSLDMALWIEAFLGGVRIIGTATADGTPKIDTLRLQIEAHFIAGRILELQGVTGAVIDIICKDCGAQGSTVNEHVLLTDCADIDLNISNHRVEAAWPGLHTGVKLMGSTKNCRIKSRLGSTTAYDDSGLNGGAGSQNNTFTCMVTS